MNQNTWIDHYTTFTAILVDQYRTLLSGIAHVILVFDLKWFPIALETMIQSSVLPTLALAIRTADSARFIVLRW